MSEFVAGYLREEILSGSLKPGERIRQEAVAAECGTSRLPVREALSRLQKEGMVTLVAHVGARVAELDFAELDEIYMIRERLEPLAIRLSVPGLSDEQHERLEQDCDEMERASDPEDPARWVELDRDFHLRSYEAAQSPRLINLIGGLWNSTQQYRRAYTRLPERMKLANAEHRLLLEAIERRDAENAELLSQMHIRRTRQTLGEHGEIFEQGNGGG